MGGLVGKVLEIDEKTRLRHDYVRVKISYRDITKVPRTARSTLGLFLQDFHFGREVEEDGPKRTLNSGIKVTEGDHPPPSKKYQPDDKSSKGSKTNNADQSSGKSAMIGYGKDGGKKQVTNITMSAPPKVGGKSKSIGKLTL